MRAGDTVLALDLTEPAADMDPTSEFNSSNTTSFISATPEVSTTFVAPSSGIVWVIVGGGIRDDSNNFRGVMAPEIREDDVSGDVVYSPGISKNSWSNSSATGFYQYGSRMVPVTMLNPGATYFARVMIQVNSTAGSHTVDYFNKQIFVIGA